MQTLDLADVPGISFLPATAWSQEPQGSLGEPCTDTDYFTSTAGATINFPFTGKSHSKLSYSSCLIVGLCDSPGSRLALWGEIIGDSGIFFYNIDNFTVGVVDLQSTNSTNGCKSIFEIGFPFGAHTASLVWTSADTNGTTQEIHMSTLQ